MGKENNSATINASGSTSKKTPFYRKQTNTLDGNNTTPKETVGEIKLLLQDSGQREMSEFFTKIKEAIAPKIRKTKDTIAIAESIVYT